MRDVAVEPAGVRVDQQLGGVVPVAGRGLPRAVRAEAVPLAGADAGDGRAEDAVHRAVAAGSGARRPSSVEQAQVDAGRVRGVDGDVDARVGDVDAEAWRSPAGEGGVTPTLWGNRRHTCVGVSPRLRHGAVGPGAGGNVPRVRIVVCVKHVPDIQSERALGPDGRVVRDGGDGTLNELDENALEAALALVEAQASGSVVALTVGPDDAVDAVRRGLQMGAEDAVHVVDDAIAGSDVDRHRPGARRRDPAPGRPGAVDLVVTGMAGLDGLTSLLPTALAELLDLPALPLAAELTVDGTHRAGAAQPRPRRPRCSRPSLPALVSVTDQANEPRYPNFKGIMAARKKPVTTLTLADLEVDAVARRRRSGARTEVLEAAARPPRENRVLVQDTGDAGVRLAAYLVDNQLV